MTESDAFVQTILNLSKYHREHEKFYSDWPLDRALAIRAASRTLSTLADRWGRVEVAQQPRNPYAGCEDLNDIRTDLSGPRRYCATMYSAAELLDRAATLATESAASP